MYVPPRRLLFFNNENIAVATQQTFASRAPRVPPHSSIRMLWLCYVTLRRITHAPCCLERLDNASKTRFVFVSCSSTFRRHTRPTFTFCFPCFLLVLMAKLESHLNFVASTYFNVVKSSIFESHQTSIVEKPLSRIDAHRATDRARPLAVFSRESCAECSVVRTHEHPRVYRFQAKSIDQLSVQ